MAGSRVVDLNPLMQGLNSEKPMIPCAMVIFGAHGDLTKRKLIPALWALYSEGLLPHNFYVVGMSRTSMTNEEFRVAMRQALADYAPDLPIDDSAWEKFSSALYYVPCNFGQAESYSDLAKILSDLDIKHGTDGNHIFYLSTPPSLYSEIVSKLAGANLAYHTKSRSLVFPRIIIEKPFGHDLPSAENLNQQILQVLDEPQIYRIDHYLGKETVQNIMVLRFANGIFEPLWNREHIDHIQITNAETLGIEGRGAYYEEAGNLRDMIQNHMLQLLSIVAMEPPISLGADDVRDEKAKVLRSVRPIDAKEVSKVAVRGQYGPGWIMGQAVPGYRQEKNVAPNSNTNTYTALKLYIDNWRWAGVPFYVRSGKRLSKTMTEIAIHFRKAPHLLFSPMQAIDMDSIGPNVLLLRIQPDEGISLRFATKLPGPTTQLRELSMDFRYGTAFGSRTPTAYERLILDCILGDPSLYARNDAVEASWKLIEPVLDHWARMSPTNFPNYEAGSRGPDAADALIASTGHAWRHL
jgi:glucose-6-phosphate 1-dehydrogenase